MSDLRESPGMSFDLAAAIEAAVYKAADGTRTVEPDVVAIHILATHPDISVGWADLTLAVVETATRAGMGLRILCPMRKIEVIPRRDSTVTLSGV